MRPGGQPGCPHPQVYKGKESAWARVGPTRPADLWGGEPRGQEASGFCTHCCSIMAVLCCSPLLQSSPGRMA